MQFKTEVIDDIIYVRISTDVIDAGNIMEFKSAITPILNTSDKLILDMCDVKFMDSSGFGALLSCLRILNGTGGRLRICCVARELIKLFRLMGINRIIDMHDSKEEAIAAFRNDSD